MVIDIYLSMSEKQSKTPKKKSIQKKKANPNTKPFANFLNFLGLLIILVVFLFVGLLVYVIVDSDSRLSELAVNNTPLQNIITLQNEPSEDNNTPITTNTPEEEPKAVNNLLGLNLDNDNGLAFADPESNLTVSEAIERVLPSVISIRVSASDAFNPLQQSAAGSGYFVSEDGLIVTNKHVISFACNNTNNVSITGLTYDQEAYSLELLSVDPIEDIAILRATSDQDTQFTPVEFFDSRQAKLGTEVIAIGNTLGQLQNTVTKGIVSGLDRSLGNESPLDECTGQRTTPESLIQTDAAINQGNSGGPLFNSSGLLLGMNTYGIPSAQNIGLAIPSVRIKAALESFLQNGEIIRPRLGILSRPLTPLDKKEFDWLPVDYGELIFGGGNTQAITPNSAADNAGIKEGDIILEVNGNILESSASNPSPLRSIILNLQEGDTINLKLLKSTGFDNGEFNYESEPTTVDVTLGGINYDLPGINEN